MKHLWVIRYYNQLLQKSYTVETTNQAVAKTFLNQLATNKCIATISGNTETIQEYTINNDYDNSPDMLHLYKSVSKEGLSVWLSTIMWDQMEAYVSSIARYEVNQLPDTLTYQFMPFARGSLQRNLVDTLIPTAYLLLMDSNDTCLDVVSVICDLELLKYFNAHVI